MEETKEIKKFGTGAHIILSHDLIGKKARIKIKGKKVEVSVTNR
jgi:putative transposon-encoded protein